MAKASWSVYVNMKVNQLNSTLNGMYIRREDWKYKQYEHGMSSSSKTVMMNVKVEYQR